MADRPPATPERMKDWTYAQVQYENTTKRLVDIAAEIGVRDTQLIARASQYGWTRNRNGEALKETAALILAKQEERTLQLQAIERVNAQMQAEVLSRHRTDIKHARTEVTKLWSEISNEDADLLTLSKIAKSLSESLKTLVLLERQAFGIQGVFEDIEKDNTGSTPAEEAMQSVLNQFASVLGQVAQKPAKDMGDVIEITSPSVTSPSVTPSSEKKE